MLCAAKMFLSGKLVHKTGGSQHSQGAVLQASDSSALKVFVKIIE